MYEQFLRNDYVNLKTILELVSDRRYQTNDPLEHGKALRQLHKKRKFTYRLDLPTPDPSYTALRYVDDEMYFFFRDYEAIWQLEPEDTERHGHKRLVVPYDDEYKIAMEGLNVSIGMYKSLLDGFINGNPDYTVIEKMANQTYIENLLKIEFWAPEKDQMPYSPIRWLIPELMTLEDNLEAFGIFFYYFNGLEKIFTHIRKCENDECQRYFLPKNPKGRFCCVSCRARIKYLKQTDKL